MYIESNAMKPLSNLTLTSPPSFSVKPPEDRASRSSAEKLIWVPLWWVSITIAGTIALDKCIRLTKQ